MSNRLNIIIIVKLNFPQKNALTAILKVFLILTDEIYPVCFNSTSTAYATIDTIIIHHVYKPNFAVCVPFSSTGSWDLFAIKSAAVFGLVFF